MQMRLPRTLRISNPLLQNPLRLLDKLPMQINRVPIYPAHRIVLPEDVVARLLVVLVHHRAVPFPLFGELVRRAAVATLVGLLRFRHAGGALAGFLPGEAAQAVIFGFGAGGGGVIEGWGVLLVVWVKVGEEGGMGTAAS